VPAAALAPVAAAEHPETRILPYRVQETPVTDPPTFETIGPVVLRETEAWRVCSSAADADYEVRVARPVAGPRGGTDQPWRVLYVLDGDLFFGMAAEITRLMHLLFGELPPTLVVGVGYGTQDARVQGETRNRDFTPTSDPRMEAMARQLDPGREPVLPEGRRMGRAAEFLAFLTGELAPFLEERYPVLAGPGGATLFGSSMGGLFATWTLLTRPGAFGRYVVASPALWWDDELLFGIEEGRRRRGGGSGREEDAPEAGDAEANQARAPVRAFFGVGGLEEGAGIPGLDAWKLVTNTRRMAERLSAPGWSGIETDVHVFPGESHTSVVPVVLTRGLREPRGRAG